MHGAMPFSRWSELPGKMISMRRISLPTPHLQRSCHGRASSGMGKLRQHDRDRRMTPTRQILRQVGLGFLGRHEPLLVEVDLPNPDGALVPGSYAEVRLTPRPEDRIGTALGYPF